ncbi:hypothetical protein D3C80_2114630 [compost metagenome]
MPLRQAGKQRTLRLAEAQLVPAHMRHLVAVPGGEAHHCAGQKPQPLMLAMLLAAAEQQLHAEADPQHRLAR